jgi:hypothetical protein
VAPAICGARRIDLDQVLTVAEPSDIEPLHRADSTSQLHVPMSGRRGLDMRLKFYKVASLYYRLTA